MGATAYATAHGIGHLPRHIAIIMDGNGRWAEAHGLSRAEGHRAGAESFSDVTEEAARLGVEYLTVYAFSTENWNRPQAEVDALMWLLADSLKRKTATLLKEGIRLKTIGEIERLPETVRTALEACIRETSVGKGLTLTLALSYGGQQEIVRAARKIGEAVAAGTLRAEDIGADVFKKNLYTAEMPEIDLLIRTSGEMRLSNFLLYQAAYAELYFTDVTWPDFKAEELRKAIGAYGGRERRFGLTGAQINTRKG